MTRRHDDFVEFASSSHERMRRTAHPLCGDWHRAADITQEALIRIYLAWPHIERKDCLARYARRAVMSVVIDQARKLSSTELPALAVEATSSAHDPAGEVTDRLSLVQRWSGCPSGNEPAWCCATSRTCRSPRSRPSSVSPPGRSNTRRTGRWRPYGGCPVTKRRRLKRGR